ncbi:MAG: pyruvate kinase [Parcubacteria group bacterium Gr01-1014_49]|nr:MAG: pyruvate kinase [Parcubacteria group bacterium Gr01-1014_49]
MPLQAKKTKIVATIGPASESPDVLCALVEAGMNVARLNMSHGDHAEQGARVKNIRSLAKKLGTPIAILLDLSGPKIRTGEYTTERITIEEGKEIILTSEEIVGDAGRLYVNYPKLPQEVKEGSVIMLDDGKKKLVVERVEGTEIHCRVVVGGELKSKRGINVPGAYLSISCITEKDMHDLAFGVENEVDMIALSFVRRADDVLQLKSLLKEKGKEIPVIVKIETQEAIDNLSEILAVADGAMVARGDLAVEVPAEQVPLLQKRIIREANALGKPVITATQMLESMIQSPVPTRAEVSDIANAIFDGTDAVMLSEESTLGKYPVEAVKMMSRIAETVEASLLKASTGMLVPDSISTSGVETAEHIDAAAIVTLTESGDSARKLARFKPASPIIALSPNPKTVEQLTLVRGVYPFLADAGKTTDEVIAFVSHFLYEKHLAKTGDRIVITAGLKFGMPGSTNMLCVITL